MHVYSILYVLESVRVREKMTSHFSRAFANIQAAFYFRVKLIKIFNKMKDRKEMGKSEGE